MLTDDEKRAIRAKVSEASGEWHFDMMMFANEIERAVLAKAGEQEPVGYADLSRVNPKDAPRLTNEHFTDSQSPVYSSPLPAQAIPDDWVRVLTDMKNTMHRVFSEYDDNDTAHREIFELLNETEVLLSASPKP